jgi:hypothetical protein
VHVGKGIAKNIPVYLRKGRNTIDKLQRVAEAGTTIMGSGMYHVEKGARAVTSRRGNKLVRGPNIKHSVDISKTTTIVEHSEYIGDLITSTNGNFQAQNYALNPGLQGTFQWLSSIACNYQQYEFMHLVFEYRSTTSNATSSTTGAVVSLGFCGMGTQYDAASGGYTNKLQVENSDGGKVESPTRSFFHGVECKKRQTVIPVNYIRTGNVPTGSDIRLYDLGIVTAFTVNIPTNNAALSVGEIHVHYKVKLIKPQLNGGYTNINCANYTGTAVSGTEYWAATTGLNPSTNNFMTLGFPTNNVFTFPLQVEYGYYLVTLTSYLVGGSSGVYAPNPTALTFANCSLINYFFGDSAVQPFAPSTSATDSRTVAIFIVSINAPGSALATITIPSSGFGIGSSSSSVQLTVSPWNSTMFK